MNIQNQTPTEGADWIPSPPSVKSGMYDVMFGEGAAVYHNKKEGNPGVSIGIPGVIFDAHEVENRDEIDRPYTTFIIHTKKNGDKFDGGENQFALLLQSTGLADDFNKKFAAYEKPFDIPVDEMIEWVQLKFPAKRVCYTLEQKYNKVMDRLETNPVHVQAISTGTNVDSSDLA